MHHTPVPVETLMMGGAWEEPGGAWEESGWSLGGVWVELGWSLGGAWEEPGCYGILFISLRSEGLWRAW